MNIVVPPFCFHQPRLILAPRPLTSLFPASAESVFGIELKPFFDSIEAART
jgi:hypothetical protein